MAIELAALTGLDPSTLVAALGQRPLSDQNNVPIPVSRMGRRSSFVPLTQEEIDILGDVFTVAPQARVSGSVILNDLLRHVTDGTGWEHLEEPAASRTRLRRGCKRGEFGRLYGFVKERLQVFSASKVEGFRRLAALETQVASRL